MSEGLDEHTAVGQLRRAFEGHHDPLLDLFEPAGIEQTLIQIGGQRATQMIIAKARTQQ